MRVSAVGLVVWALAAGTVPAVTAQCDAPIDLGRGPVAFEVPDSYEADRPAPLVVLLHGRGATGAQQEAYFRLGEFADELGFLYAYPNGTIDLVGSTFWNGTDACCDFYGSGVDDSRYLRELVEAVGMQCNVDPYRIFFIGHSNGGYMAYRMACDHADVIAGIASLAGATYLDRSDCAPSDPVHVLQIHGTFDFVIRYAGGLNGGVRYPGAARSARTWAQYNQCLLDSVTLPGRLDLDTDVPGTDTDVRVWERECSPGGSAELWSITGGSHIPAVTVGFRRGVLEHLLDHPSCRGRERLLKIRCSDEGALKVKLRRGVPGDRYRVELESGQVLEGRLNRRGKATRRLSGVTPGDGEAFVRWGCGAKAARAYSCP